MDTRRMCPHCRAFITTKDRTCPYCHETVGERAVERGAPIDVLGGLIPHARFATTMILLINFGIYAAMVVHSMSLGNSGAVMDLDLQTLYQFGGKFQRNIMQGEWWRLVTAGFLHGGLIHIGMNCYVLFDLGAQVDEIYGTSRFVTFYILSTIGGFVASTFWSAAPSVGASAGLFGLIGVMIALGLNNQTSVGAAIRGMYIRWAIYGLLFGLLPYFRVDNAAHIGGLATGFVTAYFTGTPRIGSSTAEQAWRWAAWGCAAVTAYSFVRMYLSFSMQPL
jgi:rhomboid protease GluP